MGHASLEPGGSDSLGLSESLCGVVWRWLDQRVSLRVQALPSRGSTEWRKLCLHHNIAQYQRASLYIYIYIFCMYCRGRPWRYSVIPSTPDFPTEYQIRWHSNPAGLPTFAAIWGPDFRASIIRLTCPHVFKQINKNRITLMTMFKVNRGPPN